MSVNAQPLAEAVAHHGAKTPVGSVLRTKEWAKMPRELRNRAQFSAGVESARYLERVQDGIGAVLEQEQGWDRSRVIRDLMDLADQEGLRPTGKDRGGLLDPGSERRTELIYSMQTQQAYGHAEWKAGQDPDALDAAPAQELVRVEDRKVPRDWARRWVAAGGRLRDGRMVALKTDGVWEKLSRFGNPWPPFDFGSGMGVEDVFRDEAEELGLISPEAPAPEPIEAEFNQKLEAEVTGMGPEMRQNLKGLFGPQVDVDGDKVQWKADQAAAYESNSEDLRESAGRVFAGSEGVLGRLGRGTVLSEVESRILARNAREARVQIAAVATGRKPLYHEDWGGYEHADVEAAAAELRKMLPQGVQAVARDGHLYVWHPVATRLADPRRQMLPQVIEHSDNGRWLGYGVNYLRDRENVVTVWIEDLQGNRVSGFVAPAAEAELYGAARAKDWVDATGMPHRYAVTGR